jgi:hypothetical protein
MVSAQTLIILTVVYIEIVFDVSIQCFDIILLYLYDTAITFKLLRHGKTCHDIIIHYIIVFVLLCIK